MSTPAYTLYQATTSHAHATNARAHALSFRHVLEKVETQREKERERILGAVAASVARADNVLLVHGSGRHVHPKT